MLQTHHRRSILGAQEVAGIVDSSNQLEYGLCHLFQTACTGNTGIADKHVHTAKEFHDLVHHSSNGFLVGNVDTDRQCHGRQFCGGSGSAVIIHIRNNDVRTLSSHVLRNALAEALCATGNNRHLVGQTLAGTACQADLGAILLYFPVYNEVNEEVGHDAYAAKGLCIAGHLDCIQHHITGNHCLLHRCAHCEHTQTLYKSNLGLVAVFCDECVKIGLHIVLTDVFRQNELLCLRIHNMIGRQALGGGVISQNGRIDHKLHRCRSILTVEGTQYRADGNDLLAVVLHRREIRLLGNCTL